MTIYEFLHKRVLVASKDSHYASAQKIEEVKVLEISPSAKWVKIQNQNGAKFWKSTADFVPIEVLEPTGKPD